jgi:hypothetical protein
MPTAWLANEWDEARHVPSLAYRLTIVAGCLFFVSACGGGGGSVAPQTGGASGAPVTKPTAGPQGFTPVSFSISLAPRGTASTARRPMFVPASTTTISVAVNGTTPQSFPCVATTCTGTFSSPAGGTVNFVFAALDSQQHAVSESSFSQTINANGANTLNVTLEGVVDHASLALATPGIVSYQSGSATVTATAFDVDEDVITGPYFAPLVLSVSGDATGTITVPSATVASSTSTGTVAYTFSAATQYAENHVTVQQTSTTETAPSGQVPFEVGRTFYTFTSASTIVGFAPGSSIPTRTVTMPTLDVVDDITCDGSNLYLNDGEDGAVYGLGPTAISPVTYTNTLTGPNWVAADGGITPSNHAQMYVANGFGVEAIVGFQGSTSAPPFPLPPDTAVQGGGGESSRGSIAIGPTGNVFASFGGPSYEGNGGWEVLSPTLTAINGGMNANGTSDDIIALDTSVSPMRIYVEGFNASTFFPEIDEYDNFATTPTYISSDSNDTGLFVDSIGRIYTSKAVAGLPGARARNPGRGNTSVRRRTLAGVGNSFDVYAPGGLAGAIQYNIPGESLAIDSQNYIYALQDGGSINIYAPGGTTIVGQLPGTNYGVPSGNAFAFGTFCR